MSSTDALRTPLPYVSVSPDLVGNLRQRPEHFQVEEILGFEPAGEGEHIFLFIEKTTLNTQQVANKLADIAAVPVRQVSYAGMKDRNAITRQWFSVHLPGYSQIDFSAIDSDQVTVLKQQRHLRKLRRGVHKGNRFEITLSHINGISRGSEVDKLSAPVDQLDFEQRISVLSSQGFPNYFGEQRFGRNGSNLEQVEQWFAGGFKPKKHQRGLYLSTARSFLFNQVLAERVREKSWDRAIPGELLMLDGTQSVFPQGSENLEARIHSGDIHPTGPMYGKSGKLMPGEDVAGLEARLLNDYVSLTRGLELHGLTSERRALRVIPKDLKHILIDDQLVLTFSLPRGCYATALVRELVNYQVE